MAWAAAMRAASCSKSSSRSAGLPGNRSPNCSMNDSNDGSIASPASRCSIIRLRASNASRMWASCCRVGIGQRLGHLLEVGPGHLLAEPLDQLLEVLTGLGGDELVVLQAAHHAGQVAREQVELHPPFRGHLVGDLLTTLVPGVAGVGLELFDADALLGQDLLELLGHLAVGAAQITAVELLLPLEPQLVEQVAQPLRPARRPGSATPG